MRNPLDTAVPSGSGELAPRPTSTVQELAASRAVATDRIFRGGLLAILGFAGALLVEFLHPRPGLPLWIGGGAALAAFGAGAVWAGRGASHLVRHGRRGSSLWLLSLAGLGGSVIVNVVTATLMTAWYHPAVDALHRLAITAGALFTAALAILGLITLLRGLLAHREPTP